MGFTYFSILMVIISFKKGVVDTQFLPSERCSLMPRDTIPSSFECFACCSAEFNLSTLKRCSTQTNRATGMKLSFNCRTFQEHIINYQLYTSTLSRNEKIGFETSVNFIVRRTIMLGAYEVLVEIDRENISNNSTPSGEN